MHAIDGQRFMIESLDDAVVGIGTDMQSFARLFHRLMVRTVGSVFCSIELSKEAVFFRRGLMGVVFASFIDVAVMFGARQVLIE